MLDNSIYIGQYIGKTMCGFINGYNYSIDIQKNIYGYTVSGVKNLTEDTDTNACINYASEKSLRSKWLLVEDNEEDNAKGK